MISKIIEENFFFLFILFFSYLSYIRFSIANKNIILLSLFFLPATFLHELAHLIVGIATFAKPTSFNLIPKKENDSYVLGSVNFKNINFFNAFPVSIAPLILLVLVYVLDKNNFQIYKKAYELIFHNTFEFNLFTFLSLIYLNYILIYSGIPSVQDFRVLISKPVGLFFWILVIIIIIGFHYDYEISFILENITRICETILPCLRMLFSCQSEGVSFEGNV